MFSFAAPLAFALALIAIPIIGFYLLKVKLRRVPVSTNLFWKQIYEEKPPRSLWQQMRHWISLAIQLMILCLLILAIADPFLPWQKQQAQRLCLIIDNSASMSAKHDSTTRLAEAKRRAIDRLDGIRELDEVAIIVVNDSPQVLVGMTSHVPTLKKAVQSIAISPRRSRLLPAIDLGKRLIGEHPNAEIVLFTDAMSDETDLSKEQTTALKIPENEKSQEPAPPLGLNDASGKAAESNGASEKAQEPYVRWELVANPQNNLGITQFQVRRSLVDAIGYEVLVEVLNASDAAIEARLDLFLNDATMDVLPLRLAAGEKWSKSLEKTSLEGGVVSAELNKIQRSDTPAVGGTARPAVRTSEEISGGESVGASSLDATGETGRTIKRSINSELNAIAFDDRAVAILPERRKQNVLIVTPGNLFLRRAFEANPLVNVVVVNEPPATWPADHLIVLHKIVPTEFPSGNVFVIDPGNDSKFWKVDGEIDDPIVTEQLDDSPLMRHVRMDNVVVPKAKKLTIDGSHQTLAGTVSKEVVYAELRNLDSRLLVLNVPLEESDLAFRTTFPILVTNALYWFARQDDEFTPALITGSIETLQFSKRDLLDPASLQLIAPNGEAKPIQFQIDGPNNSGDSVQTSLGPFSQCGVWVVATKQSGESSAIPQNPSKHSASKPSASEQSASEQSASKHGTSEHGNGELNGESNVLKSYAVNLSDARESDVRSQGELAAITPTPMLAGGAWFTRPLWFYIALLGCLACVLEWVLYQRRIIT